MTLLVPLSILAKPRNQHCLPSLKESRRGLRKLINYSSNEWYLVLFQGTTVQPTAQLFPVGEDNDSSQEAGTPVGILPRKSQMRAVSAWGCWKGIMELSPLSPYHVRGADSDRIIELGTSRDLGLKYAN